MVDVYFGRFVLPEDLHAALMKCRSIAYIETQEELDELVFGPTHSSRYDVVYNIVGKGSVKEAEVIRCKNGASVNFMEDYMRRRDPNSMVISDDPTSRVFSIGSAIPSRRCGRRRWTGCPSSA